MKSTATYATSLHVVGIQPSRLSGRVKAPRAHTSLHSYGRPQTPRMCRIAVITIDAVLLPGAPSPPSPPSYGGYGGYGGYGYGYAPPPPYGGYYGGYGGNRRF